ncbi:MAG: ABC transporter permease [Thermoplasmata archaeon]|nr:ABC transporter permease [Thermoplasmata archaeon]
MKIRRVVAETSASIRNWYRSRASVFWTLAFPIMLILIFGAIFSGGGENYEVYVMDHDNSFFSHEFIHYLNSTGVIDVKNIGENESLKNYVKNAVVISIPQGFGDNLSEGKHVEIEVYVDPSNQQTNQVVENILSAVINNINFRIYNITPIITYTEKKIVGEKYTFIDFFVPGIIGMTIMTSSVYASIEMSVKYRKMGLLKKLLTTPMSRGEWLFGRMLYQVVINSISFVAIIITGMAIYSMHANINLLSILALIISTFAFTGTGMFLSRFVKDEETADSAASAIIFPMMFLSGTFFPLQLMPSFLQIIAKFLPLYYVNESFRNAMIYMDYKLALFNMAVVAVYAAVVFILGVMFTKWKEE